MGIEGFCKWVLKDLGNGYSMIWEMGIQGFCKWVFKDFVNGYYRIL